MKISIIIPVYNGEKNISACIESLISQKYDDIEILVINDGSTDGTERVVNACVNKDKRIKLFNKNNSGVSDTRNYGISKASGQYIMFVDADDYLNPNAIESLVNNIKNTKSDMAIFGFKVCGDNNRPNDTEILDDIGIGTHNTEQIINKVLCTKSAIYGYVWRAIYSSQLIKDNNIYFPKGIKISEDYLFFVCAIAHAEKIFIDSEEYYNYVINDGSMSIKYIPSLLNDMCYVNKYLLDNIVSKNEKLRHGYNCCQSNTYLRYVQNIFRNEKLKFIDKYREAKSNREKFAEDLKKIKFLKDFNLKDSIQIYMIKSPLLLFYCVLFELKGKLYR